MGIVTEKIEINIAQKTAKYYEGLGYNIPKIINNKGKEVYEFGKHIIVKIQDLPKMSGQKILVKCDYCNKEYLLPYCDYTKRKHDGKIYCKNCMPKVILAGYGSPRWNKNKTLQEREIERDYPEYTSFIKRVLIRDNFTCQCCNKTNFRMEVHHLDGYNWCIEKRTDETNAITLCEKCHSNFHLEYGNGDNTKEQFEKWIGKSLEILDKYNGILPTRKKVYCLETNEIFESSEEASKLNNDSESNIKRCCNISSISKSSKGKHYFWLKDYEKMSKEEINNYLQNKLIKKVYCITYNKLFDSAVSAAKFYNITDYGKSIMICCKNKTYYSGVSEDGTCLQWCYYKDYLNMVEQGIDIKKLYEEKLLKSQKSKTPVICLNTLETFDSCEQAKRKMGLSKGVCITNVCKGKLKSSGKHPKTGEPLRWMYLNDYKNKKVA